MMKVILNINLIKIITYIFLLINTSLTYSKESQSRLDKDLRYNLHSETDFLI